MITHLVNPIARDDLLEKLRALKPELVERYDVSRIGIFGSVARNNADVNSDIDIVVHMLPDILKRIRLKLELEEKFGKKVDVVRYWHGMNQYLKERIDREAMYA